MLSSTTIELDAESAVVASASNTTPVVISSNSATTISSTIELSGVTGIVTDINVSFDITYGSARDLTGVLIAPDGSRVELFENAGRWFPNFTGTTLDDDAAASIDTADAPFTGSFRPHRPLSNLNGINPNGTWTLEITDKTSSIGGQLNEWSIEVTAEDVPFSGQDVNGDFFNIQNVVLPVGSPTTITSTIDVAGLTGSLDDVDVNLDITYGSARDLTATLIAPNGTRVRLFNRIGQWFPNFTDTTLDDEAATSINSAAAPFTGTFQPDQPLSALDGIDPNGTWTLEIVDHIAADGGQLNNWSLSFVAEGDPPPPPPPPPTGVVIGENTTPVVISSNSATTISSTIELSGVTGIVTDINVSFDITYGSARDLTGVLIAPDGSRVELFENAGRWFPNFTGTTLDDDAATSIDTADAPFTGTFRPHRPLSNLNGINPNGTWTLEITDKTSSIGGQLNEWSIEVTAEDVPFSGQDTNGDFFNIQNVVLPVGSPTTITSTIDVAGLTGSLDDVDVNLDITYGSARDLTATLIAPNGTRVRLFNRIGQWFPNFTDSTLDDEAATSINSAAAPFTGTFQPDQPLSALDGIDPNGTWTLEIVDHMSSGGGQLNNWSIDIDTNSPPPPGGTSGTIDISQSSINVGQPINLTVNDLDLTGLSQIQAVVTVGGDSETVVLNAQGNGVFSAQLTTSAASGTNNDGTLNVTAGEVIAATYNDAFDVNGNAAVVTDTATIGSQTSVVSLNKSTYEIGEVVSITLDDVDFTGLGSVTVQVNAGLDVESVVLTAAGGGVFTGSIGSNGNSVVIGNGTLNVTAGDNIQVSFTDPIDELGNSRQVNDTAGFVSAPGTTGTISITQSSINVGESIDVTVNDLDLDGLAQLQVDVTVGDDLESLVLSAVGNGVFTGQISSTAAAGGNQNGILNVTAGETITATYQDALNANATSSVATDTANINTHTAILTLDKSVYEVGEAMSITLTDLDLTGLTSVNVQVTAFSDTEVVTLTSSGNSIFTGSLPTSENNFTANDGILGVSDGEFAEATYTDPIDAVGLSRVVFRSADFVEPTPIGTSGTINIVASSLNVGENVVIIVNDADLSGLNQISVSVNSGSGDVENLTLAASGGGVFTGQLATTAATGSSGNGTLNVIAGNVITATYNDASDEQGDPATVNDTATISTHLATLGFNQNQYDPGETLTITLTDVDLTGIGSVDVVVDSVGDSETVTLVAAGNGVFTATLPTTDGSSSPGDQLLEVEIDETITASYTDAINPSGSSQLVQATALIVDPTAAPAFEIVVRFTDSSLTPSQQAIFADAAARWSEIIVGDLPDFQTSIGVVDDVVIDAFAPAIDGPGGILGSAGPREVRPGSFLPAYGVMRFDAADVANLESSGRLVDVILHEMGHVIGIGTLWSLNGLLTGAGTSNPLFTGTNARIAYGELLGTGPTDVPVANTGGAGTRDSHWRESTFGSELMTGFLSGNSNPISKVTVASLADIGYVVDMNAADPFVLPGSSFVASSIDTDAEVALFGLDDDDVHPNGSVHYHLDSPEVTVLSVEAYHFGLNRLESASERFRSDDDWFDQF